MELSPSCVNEGASADGVIAQRKQMCERALKRPARRVERAIPASCGEARRSGV